MAEQKPKYWFKRRRYGYGWIPVTKQGWLFVLGYITTLLLGALLIVDENTNEGDIELWLFLSLVFFSTIFVVFVTYKKGPKPKWRWGKKPEDNPEEDF